LSEDSAYDDLEGRICWPPVLGSVVIEEEAVDFS